MNRILNSSNESLTSMPSVTRPGFKTLRWRHNGHDSVSNHQPHECLLNRLFRRRSRKTSKLRVTGLCVGSNAENVSIWWRHHDLPFCEERPAAGCMDLNMPFWLFLHRPYLNFSPPGQNGRHFTDDIFRFIFVNEKFCILIKILLKFVPKVRLTTTQHWFGAE